MAPESNMKQSLLCLRYVLPACPLHLPVLTLLQGTQAEKTMQHHREEGINYQPHHAQTHRHRRGANVLIEKY